MPISKDDMAALSAYAPGAGVQTTPGSLNSPSSALLSDASVQAYLPQAAPAAAVAQATPDAGTAAPAAPADPSDSKASSVGQAIVSTALPMAGMAQGAMEGAGIGSMVAPGVGTAIGAGVGALAGAGAGSFIAATANALGRRLMGSKKSDEQLSDDIGRETLVNLTGQMLGEGAAPALGALLKAGRTIGATASSTGKEVLAQALGQTTGKGAGAMHTLFEDAPAVVGNMKKYLADAGGDVTTAVGNAKDAAIQGTRNFLQTASDALPAKYRELLGGILNSPEAAKMNVNMGDVFATSAKALEDGGFGRVIPTETGAEFKAFSPKEMAERAANGQDIQMLTPEAADKVAQLAQVLGNFSKAGEVKGKAGANMLVQYNKLLNSVQGAARDSGDTAFKAVMDKVGSGFRNGVGQQFENAGLGAQYRQLAQTYAEHGNSVDAAHKLLSQPTGAEQLLNRLATDTAKNRTSKGMVQNLVNLVGDSGQSMLKDIAHKDAASKFIPWAPDTSKLSTIGAGIASGKLAGSAVAALPTMVGAPIAAATATQFSPRMVASEVHYAQGALSFINSLGPKQLNALLKNDTALKTIVQTTAIANLTEKPQQQMLLKAAGATNGQGGQ